MRPMLARRDADSAAGCPSGLNSKTAIALDGATRLGAGPQLPDMPSLPAHALLSLSLLVRCRGWTILIRRCAKRPPGAAADLQLATRSAWGYGDAAAQQYQDVESLEKGE